MNQQNNVLFIESNNQNKQQAIFKELRSLKGSLMFYDADYTAYNQFSGYLRSKGYKVFLWNPASDVTFRFSPLSFFSKDNALAVVEAEVIASTIFPSNDYWEGNARNLLIALLLYFNQYNEQKVSVQDILNFMLGDDVIYDIAAILDNKKELHELAYQFFAHFLNKADSERSGVMGCLMDKIGSFRDPYIAASTAKNDFELSKVITSKTAVFIIDNPIAKKRTKHMLRIFSLQLLRLLQNTELKKPVKIIYNNAQLLQRNKLIREYDSLANKVSISYFYKNLFQLMGDHRDYLPEFISTFDNIITNDVESLQVDEGISCLITTHNKLKLFDDYVKKEEPLPINKPVRIPTQKLHSYLRKIEKKNNNISYLYLVKDNVKAQTPEAPEDEKK
jgi:hypothetical protein